MRLLTTEEAYTVAHVHVHGPALPASRLVLAAEPGTPTPPRYRAPTVAESALAVIGAAPQGAMAGIEGVAAGRFDGAGLLAVWALLNPREAVGLRERLVAAARAAAFHVSYDLESSAFACMVNTWLEPYGASPREPDRDAELYRTALPVVEQLLTSPRDFDLDWIGEYSDIIQSRALSDSGAVQIEDVADLDLKVLDTPLSLHPIMHYTLTEGRSRLLTVRSENTYTLEYRLEGWTQSRGAGYLPRIALGPLATRLNLFERNQGRWRAEAVDAPRPRLFLDAGQGRPAPSSIDRETVLAVVCEFLHEHARDRALRWDPEEPFP
jgi:hypothetical protein